MGMGMPGMMPMGMGMPGMMPGMMPMGMGMGMPGMMPMGMGGMGMGMGGMMPMPMMMPMMCRMTMEKTKDGCMIRMQPMESSPDAMQMMQQRCEMMMSMLGGGMPATLCCNGVPMMAGGTPSEK
jgi:hypothetical protein